MGRAPTLLGLLLVCGCSLITSFDALRGSSDGGQSGDAGSNLVPNGGFEQGSGGCGVGWGAGYNATYALTTSARTGSAACVVCAQPGIMGSYAMDLQIPIQAQPGSYVAEAWLSTPDGGIATTAGILVSYGVDGGVTNCSGQGLVCQGSIVTPPMGGWTPSSVSFQVTSPEMLSVQLHSFAGNAGSCFVVDDVTLSAQ